MRLAYETLEFLFEKEDVRLEPQILLIQIQHVIWGEVGLEGRRPGQHVLHFLTMSEAVDA